MWGEVTETLQEFGLDLPRGSDFLPGLADCNQLWVSSAGEAIAAVLCSSQAAANDS